MSIYTHNAFADSVDGIYGRLDGDVQLQTALGAEVGKSLWPTVEVVALYLHSVGAYGGFAVEMSDEDAALWMMHTGVQLQPLFLGRVASDLEHGPAHLDLIMDSWALRIGSFFVHDSENSWRTGIELGTGFTVPIQTYTDGIAIGLMPTVQLLNSPEGSFDNHRFYCNVTLRWHETFNLHVVDANDRR